jgi:hypothetical protein
MQLAIFTLSQLWIFCAKTSMHVSETTDATLTRSQQFTNNLQVQNTRGNPVFLSVFLSFLLAVAL